VLSRCHILQRRSPGSISAKSHKKAKMWNYFAKRTKLQKINFSNRKYILVKNRNKKYKNKKTAPCHGRHRWAAASAAEEPILGWLRSPLPKHFRGGAVKKAFWRTLRSAGPWATVGSACFFPWPWAAFCLLCLYKCMTVWQNTNYLLQSKYHFTSQPCSVIMYKNTVTNATTVRDRCKSAERLRLTRAISLVELSHYSDLFLLPSRVGVGKTAGLGTLGWVVTRLIGARALIVQLTRTL